MKLKFKKAYDQYEKGAVVDAGVFEPTLRQRLVDLGFADVKVEKKKRETAIKEGDPPKDPPSDPE